MSKFRDPPTEGCSIEPTTSGRTHSNDFLAPRTLHSIPLLNFIGDILHLHILLLLASSQRVLLSTLGTCCDDACNTLSLAWATLWCHTFTSLVFVTCTYSKRTCATRSYSASWVSNSHIFNTPEPLWISYILHLIGSSESFLIRTRNLRFLAWNIVIKLCTMFEAYSTSFRVRICFTLSTFTTRFTVFMPSDIIKLLFPTWTTPLHVANFFEVQLIVAHVLWSTRFQQSFCWLLAFRCQW